MIAHISPKIKHFQLKGFVRHRVNHSLELSLSLDYRGSPDSAFVKAFFFPDE